MHLRLATGTGVQVYRRIMTTNEPDWVPPSCTLPTAEKPLRVADFDELFATALRSQQRMSRTRLRWNLDGDGEETARDLAAREVSCCSFFTFTFTRSTAGLDVDVDVPSDRVEVLDAIATRAAARMPT